jgi:hypothetical protein
LPPHTRLHPEPNLVTQPEGGRGYGNEAQWSIGQHHHAGGAMVISHILDIYSLADRRPDGWTVKADGDASEIPKRRIVRPVVGSRVGKSLGRWAGSQKNQVFRQPDPIAAAPGPALKIGQDACCMASR